MKFVFLKYFFFIIFYNTIKSSPIQPETETTEYLHWDLNAHDFFFKSKKSYSENSWNNDFIKSDFKMISSFEDKFLVDKEVVNNGGAFIVEFYCHSSVEDNSKCLKAQKGFLSATERISSLIVINTPIVVQATFLSYCDVKSDCSSKILGQAAPSSYFGAKFINQEQISSIPQALMKQLPKNNIPNYLQFDIAAQFNADADFWFKGDPPIKTSQIDFEYCITHELIHGLGFDTHWTQFSSSYPQTTSKEEYLAPDVLVGIDENQNDRVLNFLPLTIFDKFGYDSLTSISLLDYANSILNFDIPVNLTLKKFLESFENSKEPFMQSVYVYQIVTSGERAVTFKNPHNDMYNLKLYTEKNYQKRSSLAHLDYDLYFQTPEFLMIPSVESFKGMTLDQIIDQNTKNGANGPHNVLGPLTIELMHALGTATKKDFK
ncbi:hypothetical protein HDU92_003255 [Lobulomyces angularis]|nr:hypothetical protein HDU92_003255 [Lobulomyces angularis]